MSLSHLFLSLPLPFSLQSINIPLGEELKIFFNRFVFLCRFLPPPPYMFEHLVDTSNANINH